MPDNFEKPNSLDALEQRLYSPRKDVGVRARKPLHEKEYVVARDWGEHAQTDLSETTLSVDRSKKNWFTRFFILALVFFVAALGYVGVKFFLLDGMQANNVDISVNAPLAIGAGEVFTFDTLIQNRNATAMQTVSMEVTFPDGTRSVQDISKDYRITREEIDDVASGSVGKKTLSALLFGEEGDKKEISVLISYRMEGSNSVFEKEKKFDVVLKSTPVRLTVTSVKELTSGQPLLFNVELVSNSTQVLENVMVQATYPFGFIFGRSSIPVKDDKRTWIIPRLEPKEVASFTVEGTLEGQNNDERYFSFIAGLEDALTGNPEVVFTTTGTTLSLERPFLELDLAINKDNSDVVALDSDAVYDAVVSFKNNTDYPLRNVSLRLKLEGTTISKESIQVNGGFYQSANNTIVWDNTTSDRFSSLPVGTSGSVSFNFRGRGIQEDVLASNPEMTLTATVEGNRNPDDEVPETIENSVVRKIRFNTQTTLITSSEYYTSTFQNTGPIPPKAEQETTYTAVVEVSNSANAISNGIVSMKIPNYVTYKGVTLPGSENVAYDSTTRTISWNLGTIAEKTGYSGNAPRKLAFQVGIIPSVSQAGSSPNLVYDIRLDGSDAFTGEPIMRTGQPISTAHSDSKAYYDSQVSR